MDFVKLSISSSVKYPANTSVLQKALAINASLACLVNCGVPYLVIASRSIIMERNISFVESPPASRASSIGCLMLSINLRDKRSLSVSSLKPIRQSFVSVKSAFKKVSLSSFENPFSNSSRLFFSVQKSYVVYAISNSILSCAVRSFFNLLQ